ncbi:hypothetical protein [Mumia sp. Pv 4-285]|uniref:hypothetical protein n=1 Tax=Mumia qirimensis TaxID=3234852 RepID=UPI00351D8356
MSAARWWGGWLVTVVVGYGILPAVIGFWPWLSDAPPAGCEAPAWCLSSREQGRFVLLVWSLMALPFVLPATFVVLVLIRWAMARGESPMLTPSRVLGVLRLAILLIPSALAFMAVAS